MKKSMVFILFIVATGVSMLSMGWSAQAWAGTKTAALLVIDMQNDNTDPSGAVGSSPYVQWGKDHKVVPQLQKALELARKQDMLIVHVVVSFRNGYPEKAAKGFWAGIPSTGGFVEGSWGAQVIPALKPHLGPREIIIAKKRCSSFYGTELREILVQNGIDTLVVSGQVADSCIAHTVADAVDYGYPKIAVLSDCVIAASDSTYAVLTKETWPFHGVDVISVGELNNYLHP